MVYSQENERHVVADLTSASNGEEDNVMFASDLSEALKILDGMLGNDEDDEREEKPAEKPAENDYTALPETLSEVDGPPLKFLRGSNNKHRSLQMLTQDGDHDGKWDCLDLDIVDACRGTSVSQTYRGNFKIFDGNCRGDFVDGLPIYVSSDKPNRPLYIYALGVYDETWSVAALRGLTRWRIVSFQNFDDKTSCRVESANIFQIEFAAEGQPYNYYPTIYCFDENGNDFSGFKSSTINIRCNDKADTIGGQHSSSGGSAGVVAGVIIGLVLLAVAGYCLWKRYKNKGYLFPPSPKSYHDDDYDSRYPQSRASDSRFTRETGTRDDSREYDSRDINEYVDEEPLKSKKIDSHTTKTSDQTPDTVFVPTIEEPSEPSYVDEIIEDPINDLKSAAEATGSGPGKLKIPEMFSKFAPKQQPQNLSSPSSPKPMQIEPQSEPDSPSRPQTRPDTNTLIPAPSGHVSTTRYMPEKQPSRSAVSKDITDIVDTIDQELDDVISSATEDNRSGGRRSRGYGSGASTGADDERSDYSNRRREASPKRRPSSGFGSSGHGDRSKRRPSNGFATSEHMRRPSEGFGSSTHNRSRSADSGRKKDPFMDLSRRSKFKAIQRNFSDKSKALGRNLADSAEKLKDRAKRSRSEERSRTGSSRSLLSSSSGHNRNDRSRSMERWASANKNMGRTRSQSRDRSNHADRRDRSQSRERSNHGNGSGTRGLSKERSRAAEIFANRNRSRSQSRERSGSSGYADKDRNRSRSRSTDRSNANNFADKNRSSRGKPSSQHAPRPPSSRDRMSASDHTGNRRSGSNAQDRIKIGSSSDHSGKPSSDGWATAGEQAKKRRERSRSLERSRHDYKDRSPSPYKERNRSLSRERGGAEDFANRKGRSSGPSSSQPPRNPSFSTPLTSTGSPSSAKGRGNMNASQLGRTVTKNEDGSVTVAVKRTREDGAIVTTKTKYASVGLAKRHGVEVD
jgi:hypothetical protein